MRRGHFTLRSWLEVRGMRTGLGHLHTWATASPAPLQPLPLRASHPSCALPPHPALDGGRSGSHLSPRRPESHCPRCLQPLGYPVERHFHVSSRLLALFSSPFTSPCLSDLSGAISGVWLPFSRSSCPALRKREGYRDPHGFREGDQEFLACSEDKCRRAYEWGGGLPESWGYLGASSLPHTPWSPGQPQVVDYSGDLPANPFF